MPWRQIGAVLIVLLIIFVVGNVWFHFVEAIVRQLKKWLLKRKKPTAWYSLPPEPEGEDD